VGQYQADPHQQRQRLLYLLPHSAYNAPSKYSAWPERLKHSDFSLIQPHTHAGQFLSEEGRFATSEKHILGQQAKQEQHRTYEAKLQRVAAWKEGEQERATQQERRS
jgi:hypothetical protein